uniref:Uncharacterized protein n=1 Tax=Magallana gigas TaxID=29159 RepID=A0A8W8MYI7_MAGGI
MMIQSVVTSLKSTNSGGSGTWWRWFFSSSLTWSSPCVDLGGPVHSPTYRYRLVGRCTGVLLYTCHPRSTTPLLRTNLEHLTKHIPRHRTDEEVTEMPENIFKQLSYDLLWGMLARKLVTNVVVECMY